MNNYSDQLKYLEAVKFSLNLDCFGLDDCNAIDSLLPNTGLKLGFIFDSLRNYRTQSISTAGFAAKGITLRTHLHNHVDRRIYFLKHLSKIKLDQHYVFNSFQAPKIGRDPWLSMTQRVADSEKKALVAASLHIRDTLFVAREITRVIPEKANVFLKQLASFNSKLPAYFKLLTHVNPEEIEKMKKAFAHLHDLVKTNKLDEVKAQLSCIRKTLRHCEEITSEARTSLDSKLSDETD